MMKKLSYHLNLIRTLSLIDFKLKYYGTFLGILWSLLKPFLMFLTLYIIFSKILQLKAQHYAYQLLLGIIIWNFFADFTKEAMKSFKSKYPILNNIKVNPLDIILVALGHSLLSLIINLGIFFIILNFELPISFNLKYFLLILLSLIFFSLGVSLIITPFYLRFSDVEHIWDVILQLLFWATPITYGVSFIPQKYLFLHLLNPLSITINSLRSIIIFKELPIIREILFSFGLTFCTFIVGFLIFQKLTPKFLEYL